MVSGGDGWVQGLAAKGHGERFRHDRTVLYLVTFIT